MAFCKNCGTQLAEGAAFCPSCGTPAPAPNVEGAAVVPEPPAAPVEAPEIPAAPEAPAPVAPPAAYPPPAAPPAAYPPPAAPPGPGFAPPQPPAYPPAAYAQAAVPPKKGGKGAITAIVVLVIVAALAAGGWFLWKYLEKRAVEKRATAQAEVVADFIVAMTTEDVDLLLDTVSEDLEDSVKDVLGDSEPLDDYDIDQKWDDGVLVLTIVDSDGWEQRAEIEADGDEKKAEVTVEFFYGDDEDSDKTDVLVELEGDRWIVTEIDGDSIEDLFVWEDDFGDYDEDSYYDEDDDEYTNAENGAYEDTCQANMRVIEGAVQQYLAADPSHTVDDVWGWLEEGTPLIKEGYLKDVPYCPSDEYDTPYWIYEDATTDCPAYVHEYYGN
jgi:RNA polymerase subunit RPABC4/transcription elongation factor Spt4/type II secretory pathway pseudopilin PulG